MATVSASLALISEDLTTDSLSLSTSSSLKKAGQKRTNLDNTTGVARKSTTSTDQYTLFYADEYTADKAHKVYLKNTSTVASEFFTVSLEDKVIGRLYAQDFAFFPWSATDGTREVFTCTTTGTYAAGDSLTFDGVTVTSTTTTLAAMSNLLRAATYPNWVASGTADAAEVTFTAKKARADQEIDASEWTLVDLADSNATFAIATVTEGLDNASNIKITPSVATTMKLEHALLYEL
jgi:hypothetical protein|tara:strand:+ start:377 stop:1084 length:708 start_codon:yes stop_codon:yes gene_type:complete